MGPVLARRRASEGGSHVDPCARAPGVDAPDTPLPFTVRSAEDGRYVAEFSTRAGQPETEALTATLNAGFQAGDAMQVVAFTERYDAALDLGRKRLLSSNHDVQVDLTIGGSARTNRRSRRIELDWAAASGCD